MLIDGLMLFLLKGCLIIFSRSQWARTSSRPTGGRYGRCQHRRGEVKVGKMLHFPSNLIHLRAKHEKPEARRDVLMNLRMKNHSMVSIYKKRGHVLAKMNCTPMHSEETNYHSTQKKVTVYSEDLQELKKEKFMRITCEEQKSIGKWIKILYSLLIKQWSSLR